ncbi:hypothetical protein [Neomoorella mulderi]|uniref:Uncharacterized protein n=1 Tax=Moorella mulderi DSM 14980 TaxID=1122241 RepID=A0A151ASN6_9FIRM|nr:hypothetical protein [Moorella mulderi]KYH30661.1 hypothetical protein MOMUL_29940 [Moorella mulderi DSM 14980]
MYDGKRRLDLWLPDDHPVWSFPKGDRSRKVRELLDLAMCLERGFGSLEARLGRLEVGLGRLEERLVRLEEAVAHGGAAVQSNKVKADGGNIPDLTSFLSAFG